MIIRNVDRRSEEIHAPNYLEVFFPGVVFQGGDEFFHTNSFVSVENEKRVGRVDDDEIANTDERDQFFVRSVNEIFLACSGRMTRGSKNS
jgi:hypothetical protein